MARPAMRRLLDWIGESLYGGGYSECPNCLERYPAYRISAVEIPKDENKTEVEKVCDVCGRDIYVFDSWMSPTATETLNCGKLARRWAKARGRSSSDEYLRMLWYIASELPCLGQDIADAKRSAERAKERRIEEQAEAIRRANTKANQEESR